MTRFLTTLRHKLSGFADSLAFSNRWMILLQRLTRPSDPLLSYCWRNQWWLVCDTRLHDAHAAKEVLAQGCYRPWIQKCLREGRLAYVNVGANVGAFDLAVAAESREAAPSLSIELNPHTFVRLNFNLEINGLRQVRSLNAGVARAAGAFHFQPSACSLSDGLFAPRAPVGAADVEVPLLTLDEAIARSGLGGREFDLLKLDCEGAEYGIVGGAAPDCLRRFRHIVAELHPEPAGESVAALYATLSACGFRTAQPPWVSAQKTELRFWSRV